MILTLDGGDQLQAPADLPPIEPPSTHWTGGWVSPKAGLDTAKNRKVSCPYGKLTLVLQPAISAELCRKLL
jgi:hypothetical protein